MIRDYELWAPQGFQLAKLREISRNWKFGAKFYVRGDAFHDWNNLKGSDEQGAQSDARFRPIGEMKTFESSRRDVVF